ncbi:hypothetical protein SAMN05216266_101482 [Amycolatopsis marina]|uniref:Uncharacterized protein n=1 Tax=Amycolatopsis marina TaxID=490629 RepID=A0A1I0VT85_9PSEU|nr:hypothetical protein [Amycolatopsis marina]SFA79611.1 hypothetical protein SAMN05216266_101482 [Amycolatopsis marina]
MGWDGEDAEIGGWDGGVFNGGASVWRDRAASTRRYAKGAYVGRGQSTEVAGAVATAATQTAHAVLAARGVDEIIAGMRSEPEVLTQAVTAAERLFEAARS